MPVTIRKMREADITVWAEMRFKLWDSLSVDEHLTDISKMLRAKKRWGYIALLPSGEPVGFAEICIREYANGCTAQPVPFLEGIWVHPIQLRQGIGRSIIQQITDDLIQSGFQELCSDASLDNKQSHMAHASWGFDETDRVVYFRKSLNCP
ncbi:Aminoglycoside N(6')-acetyltransferase type 1 [Pseudovibrio axinellae]|uniref:Aminoglycoside N(6')-acetyltransferase type 1 n=1 Tax=Pseudovibrio axinellae TaxID=989403 RepID=A0A166AH25_9HYPH|nr:GNAT family N-acetyltransferase [Pseudovibrio axinellae]KZL21060.1 Aminoglycoside N(6')-acetyltransferase type 1 [Pseudovibrio axinellae]SEP77009.1 aminoglycoside 6'-N-acetyltransferase I [Pseudovibrio axinellae]